MAVYCKICMKSIDRNTAIMMNGGYICYQHLMEYNTLRFCKECKEWYNSESEHTCTRTVVGLMSHNFKKPWPKDWPDQQLYGLEIEFMTEGYSEEELAKEIVDPKILSLIGNGEMAFVHDGSLLGRGIELVTKPMTIREATESDLLDRAEEIVKILSGKPSSNAAMHIHTNITDKVEKFIERMDNLIRGQSAIGALYDPKLIGLLGILFQRDAGQMIAYATINIASDHYAMFNITSSTLECRGFGAATTKSNMIRSIKLYDELMDFTIKSNASTLLENLELFVDYLSQHKDKQLKMLGEAICALLS